MNNKKLEARLNIFEIFSLTWISIAIFSLIIAVLGIFNIWLIFIGLIITIAVFAVLIKKGLVIIDKMSKFSIGMFIFIAVFGIFLSIFTTPTIFEGRDEGTYSSSAILISQEGGLVYENELVDELFDIYGPGKALNFPGFYYTQEGQLKSQFLPGYPSWISIFYSAGGIKGIKFANLFPFITFIFSILLILKLLLRKKGLQENIIKKAQFAALAMLVTSFPLVIFYKFTLSEIYFGALAWFSLYLILKYLENKSFKNYVVIFIPLVLMLFIRIEAMAIIFFFVLIMILKDANHLQKPRYQIPLIITGISFVIAIYFEPNFFINSIKNIMPFDISPDGFIEKGDSSIKTLFPDDWSNFYLARIFFIYNLITLFAMAFIVIIKSISKFSFSATDRVKKDISKINSFVLIPFTFFFPTFIYLLDANISLDHPWMLRRFAFSIIPIAILYSAIFLIEVSKKNKTLVRILAIAIVAINLSLLLPNITAIEKNFLTFSQNKKLLSQTEELAKNFSPDDLILVSQKSSGSGWSLISSAMRNVFGLKAIYFFNPDDIEKINLEKFNNIYLVTSDEEYEIYKELDLQKIVQSYKIKNSIINPSRNSKIEPSIKEYEASGKIYQIKK
ncbi:MAG: hypothetical protein PF549_04270 [Patescibacteria group bacterium]|nr:hypothetical protein [Patescibacteria group bacterium]